MSFVEVYKTKRQDIFRRVEETPVVYKLSLAFLFACLTGAGAMLRFHVPFTPVPVTLQVLFVLLSGAVLGKSYGGLSQALYIGLGFVGIPWFTTSTALFGVTGGYIIGFVFAAVIVGWLYEKPLVRKIPYTLVPMLIGLGIIYTCGALQLGLLMEIGLYDTLLLGVIPFMVLDLFKVFFASFTAAALLPEK
jgi:biotin transport system substrate-specific component